MEEKNDLIKSKNGDLSLMKNGVKTFCYKQAIAYVHQENAFTNTPSVLKQPCSNACPAFKLGVEKSSGLPLVNILCSGINVPYIINGTIIVE